MQNPWDNDPIVGAQPGGMGVSMRPIGPAKAPPPQTPAQAQKDVIDVTTAKRNAATTGAPEGQRWSSDGQALEPIPGYTPKDAPKAPTPPQLKVVREDALSKINQVRTIRRLLGDGGVMQGDFAPETGGLGWLLSKSGYGNASEIASRIETLKSGAALAEIQRWIRDTGKNPLTPMSNSDVELLSKNTGNLTLNQPESSFRAMLDEYERAYSNAYKGAGGKPATLTGKRKAKAAKGWSIEEAD